MAHIFEQFMGKKTKAPTLGDSMGSYFDQIDELSGEPQPAQMPDYSEQDGVPPAQMPDYSVRGGVPPVKMPTRPLPPKPPALDVPVAQPSRSFGSLMGKKRVARTAAPPEFKKNTMAGFLSDALRAQIISRMMSDQ